MVTHLWGREGYFGVEALKCFGTTVYAYTIWLYSDAILRGNQGREQWTVFFFGGGTTMPQQDNHQNRELMV